MSGPFKDLRTPGSGTGNTHYAFLLGTYEKSLVPVIEGVIARAPATIIDVGAGWGYYALGLAIRCPASRVIGYEIDPTRADLIRKYRRLNGLDERVDVRGACVVEALAGDVASSPDPFLLMDVEGAEDVLLDPVRAPGLRRTEILVELHEGFVPGVTARIRKRFSRTHVQTPLHSEPALVNRNLVGWLADYAVLRGIATRMMEEGRESKTSWLHLCPVPNPRQPASCETGQPFSGEHLV